MLSAEEKSQLFFLTGCIGARAALIYIAAAQPQLHLALAVFLAVIAIGILVIYVTRARPTGAETFGKPIWWDNLRPVHAGFWALSSALLLTKPELAPYALGADLAFGVGAFSAHHFT